MTKALLCISMTVLFTGIPALAEPPSPGPSSAANQYMHEADFDELVARFEDPERAQWQKPQEIVASLGSLEGKTVADIGAGTGYFSFLVAKKAHQVIAIDIDQRFLDYIDRKKQTQKNAPNIETRLTVPDSPGLKPNEADMVLIIDTFHHIEDRVEYLKNLKRGLRNGGVLVIIDFKKEKTPPGPPVELRVAQAQVESELRSAGFTVVSSDEKVLPYQYVIKAR